MWCLTLEDLFWLLLFTLAHKFSAPFLFIAAQPFVEEDQGILKFFPDKYYAIAVPGFLGVLLFAVTLTIIGGFLLAEEVARWVAYLYF